MGTTAAGDVRIVLTDVDGTLLDSAHRVSPRTAQVVREVVAGGVPFVLASGRYVGALRTVQRELGIEGPLVTCGGALVLDERGNALLSKTIDLDRACELKERIERELPDITVAGYGMDVWAVDDREDPRTVREERIVGAASVEEPLDVAFADLGGVHKLLLIGESETMAQVRDRVAAMAPDLTVMLSSPMLCEVMAADVSKAEGVRVICGHYGLDPAQAVVFGDSFNDIEMLDAVPNSYAMANAPEAVRVRAASVTAYDNDHDGLVRELEGLLGCGGSCRASGAD